MQICLIKAIAIFAIIVGLCCAPVSAQQAAVPQSRAEISLSFAPVVKQTRPAVVNIFAKQIVKNRRMLPFGFMPFGDREGFFPMPRERVKRSLGSGVIVEASGFIVTNNHVIKNGTDIRVVLSDRREFAAKVLVTDPRTDLAILKIEPEGEQLPTLSLGDSEALEVGDLVLAIGNPFGVGQTVTSGIVSALARTQVGVSSYQFFIQTDAAINPGNSGGALVDMAGRLVGINTAIFSRSGGSHGIGFAIPVNMVKSVIFSAQAGGKVVRPWSGVDVQQVTSDIAEAIGMERPHGAHIVRVHRQSPLSQAGIKRGDVIVSVNGKEIGNAREFAYRFATKKVGDVAELTFFRKGRTESVKVRLIAPPESTPRNRTVIRGRTPFTGLAVANLSPAVADELGLGSNASGVVIVDHSRGIAARYFRNGDIVAEINGRRLKTVSELQTILRRDDGWWDVLVVRKGRPLRIQF